MKSWEYNFNSAQKIKMSIRT